MSKHLSISPLFRLPKCVVEEAKVSIKVVRINIRYDERYSFYCPVCKKAMGVNRRLLQTVRDLPLGEAKVVIISYEAIQCHSDCVTIEFLLRKRIKKVNPLTSILSPRGEEVTGEIIRYLNEVKLPFIKL